MLERLREKRGDEGFTLIELLIVIVILAILATVVVFAVGNSTKNAAVSSCNADAKSVETAVEAYRAETGTFPASLAALTSSTVTQGSTVGPWLRSTPGTNNYTVSIDTSGNVFVNGTNYDTAASNPCQSASG